jgi:hypothetical protein
MNIISKIFLKILQGRRSIGILLPTRVKYYWRWWIPIALIGMEQQMLALHFQFFLLILEFNCLELALALDLVLHLAFQCSQFFTDSNILLTHRFNWILCCNSFVLQLSNFFGHMHTYLHQQCYYLKFRDPFNRRESQSPSISFLVTKYSELILWGMDMYFTWANSSTKAGVRITIFSSDFWITWCEQQQITKSKY